MLPTDEVVTPLGSPCRLVSRHGYYFCPVSNGMSLGDFVPWATQVSDRGFWFSLLETEEYFDVGGGSTVSRTSRRKDRDLDHKTPPSHFFETRRGIWDLILFIERLGQNLVVFNSRE